MPALIRPVAAGDAAAIADIYRPIVEDTIISFEETPPDASEIARRIAYITEHYPYLVAVDNGGVTGYAYASRHRERYGYRFSAEVSVSVAEHARGNGVGRALYTELFSQLRERGFHQAFAGVALPNDGSVAMHAAFGFEPIGVFREIGFKFGRWIDVAWFQRPIDR